MGTNFYTLKGKHLGKRSSAGLFCWTCKTTLRIGGESLVHHSDAKSPFDNDSYVEDLQKEWYTKCPICGEPQLRKI